MDKDYNKFLNMDKINYFDSLCGCLDNLCSCSMGLLFPYCLFGKIYERANFGSCFTGCCKLFTLQFLINTLFGSIIFLIEWNMLLKDELNYEYKINSCNDGEKCHNDYINFDYVSLNNNNCIITNNTDICDCLKKPLIEQCEKFHSDDYIHMTNYILFLSILNGLILCISTGLFLGHYRTKISHKYNILYNNRYDCLIHCNPLTNQCALCQEYNTINRIENVIKPIYAIETTTETSFNI